MNRSMQLFVAFAVLFVSVLHADVKKPARGISPAMAAGVAGGKYGVEVPVATEDLSWPDYSRNAHASSADERYASLLSLIWPKLGSGDIIVALTHFPRGMGSNPILAEGGVYWAVRRSPHEADRNAIAWAILEPITHQLLIIAPASARGERVVITSHDGWKFYHLNGECGPDGRFALEPDGNHVRILRSGSTERTGLLERIQRIFGACYTAVDLIVEKLDVDPDREPGIHGFLRVLFDLVRLVSSFSIIQGNLDKTGKSWGQDWGRYARTGAEVTYRVEDLAWRTKIPSAEGYRGDKSASRWDVLSIHQLTDLVERTYSELEAKGARPDTSWCLDYVLGASTSGVETSPPAPQGASSAHASATAPAETQAQSATRGETHIAFIREKRRDHLMKIDPSLLQTEPIESPAPEGPSDARASSDPRAESHADYVRGVKALKARTGETQSAAPAASAIPSSLPPQGEKDEVRLGEVDLEVKVGERTEVRTFYTMPTGYRLDDALAELREEIGGWPMDQVLQMNHDLPHPKGQYIIPKWMNESATRKLPVPPVTQPDGQQRPPTQQSSAKADGDQDTGE